MDSLTSQDTTSSNGTTEGLPPEESADYFELQRVDPLSLEETVPPFDTMSEAPLVTIKSFLDEIMQDENNNNLLATLEWNKDWLSSTPSDKLMSTDFPGNNLMDEFLEQEKSVDSELRAFYEEPQESHISSTMLTIPPSAVWGSAALGDDDPQSLLRTALTEKKEQYLSNNSCSNSNSSSSCELSDKILFSSHSTAPLVIHGISGGNRLNGSVSSSSSSSNGDIISKEERKISTTTMMSTTVKWTLEKKPNHKDDGKANNHGSSKRQAASAINPRSLHYCSICSKGFKDKYSVNVHVRTHTGEKPFACSMCAKHFRQKAHLAKHVQTHSAKKQKRLP